jgi:glycine/D-amino acid oxidase-like deaminating enzyme
MVEKNSSSVIVVGAGIFGVTAAIDLRQRGHPVTILDPGPLPHPLAASTDISKVVRMEYGDDEDYMALAERALGGWREWNAEFGVKLYHETGVMFLRPKRPARGHYEYESLRLLRKRGHRPELINSEKMHSRFPAFSADYIKHAFYNPEGGYAESGRVVARLLEKARSLGVELQEGTKFARLIETDAKVKGVITSDGRRIAAEHVVIATGAWTPSALPFTQSFLRAVGQPVFHLRPRAADLYQPERFPVFLVSSTTGYYGFPINRDGIVKIASHGVGREMHPESPERQVTAREEQELREFLAMSIPDLTDAPLVFTRVCLYCDTHDESFWIAPDPERDGLVVATGDSGHAFKFAPVLGLLIADAVEQNPNPLLDKFRWRPKQEAGTGEASRYRGKMQ